MKRIFNTPQMGLSCSQFHYYSGLSTDREIEYPIVSLTVQVDPQVSIMGLSPISSIANIGL
ncbi:MAG: hypothetical protein M1388_01250 [Thaumarchaeota archaeon]|nr:hypothetical protein [Nitrososphaerota archaeon]